MLQRIFSLGLFFSMCFAPGCGKKQAAGPQTTRVKFGLKKSAESFSLTSPLQFLASSPAETALNLASGISTPDWIITVDGCASNYKTRQISTTDSKIDSIPLYILDENCLAGLEQFGWQGKAYTHIDGGVLTGQEGNVAKFKNADTQEELTVAVETQLSSPITEASKADFIFFTIDQGIDAEFKDGVGVTAGVGGIEPPNFQIFKIDYTELKDGVPNWRLRFECQSPLLNSTCTTPGNEAQPLAAMKVRVVPDTFNGQPKYSDAETVFTTSQGSAVTEDTTIGSRGGMAAQVQGAGKLYDQKNLMVFLQYKKANGSSYRAYRFTVKDPQIKK